METNKSKNIKEIVDDGISLFRRAVNAYNRRLSRIYSPVIVAATGTVIVSLIAVFILFIPPVTGVADDGSLSEIMLDAGLGYRKEDLEHPVGAYFTRVFLDSARKTNGFSTHRFLIRFAKWLDVRITHDNLFDIRSLGLVYLILYLPAVFLVLRGIVARVRVAAEATALVIVGALILGDGVMISYFNSLYPEAFWQVFLVYCIGFCLALQHGKEAWTQAGLLGIMAAGSLLTLSEQHCAAVGLVLMAFCVKQIFMEDRNFQSTVLAAAASVVLVAASLASMIVCSSRFDESSKLHSITNGVMLHANHPEKLLAEFDIDPRFETLADMSVYEAYPYALVGNAEIQRDFLGKVSFGKIIFYYLRNPLSYIGLLEYGTKAAFNPNRRYVANFEESSGLPERAQNQSLIYYSNFKANSLPQTIGFLVILVIIYFVLFRKRRGLQYMVKRWSNRERQIMLDTFLCMLGIGIADITAVILLSGTSELERYQMLYGICIDTVLMLFISEILHRTNILASEG